MIPLPDLHSADTLARVLMDATRPTQWRNPWTTESVRVASCGEHWAPHIHLATGEVRHFLRLCDSPECSLCGPMAIFETLVQLIQQTDPTRGRPNLEGTWWVGHRADASTRAVANRVEHLRKRRRRRVIHYLEIRPKGGSVENAVRRTTSRGGIPQSPLTPLWVISDVDLADGTDQDDPDAWHGSWLPRMTVLRIAAAVMQRAPAGYAVSSNMVDGAAATRQRWITKHRRTPKGGHSKALYQGGATRRVLLDTECRLAKEFQTPRGEVPDGKMDEYIARYPDIVREEKRKERERRGRDKR